MIGSDEYRDIYLEFGASIDDKQLAAGKPVGGSLDFTDTVCPSNPDLIPSLPTPYLGTPLYCEQNGAIVIAGFHQGEYTRDNDDSESQALWCDKPAKFANVWFNMHTLVTVGDNPELLNQAVIDQIVTGPPYDGTCPMNADLEWTDGMDTVTYPISPNTVETCIKYE